MPRWADPVTAAISGRPRASCCDQGIQEIFSFEPKPSSIRKLNVYQVFGHVDKKRTARSGQPFAIARTSALAPIVPYSELKITAPYRNFKLRHDQPPRKLAPHRNLPHHTHQYVPKEGPLSELDLVIRGGTVIDGTGARPSRPMSRIVGNRIAAVGKICARGARGDRREGQARHARLRRHPHALRRPGGVGQPPRAVRPGTASPPR